MIIYNIIAPKFISYIIPILLMLLLVVPIILILYYMQHTTITISKDFLTIKTLFYGKKISIRQIKINELRNLNLYNNDGYNIKRKVKGIRLPSYYAGWMTLNNGNKALVHVTDKKNVLLIPTNEYDILFSTNDFDGIKKLLNDIKN